MCPRFLIYDLEKKKKITYEFHLKTKKIERTTLESICDGVL